MVILDTKAGRVVASVPIGGGVDGCGYDPETGLAFSSNGEGTLTVVRESPEGGFEVAQTVKTQRGAHTMAIDPGTHDVYLPTAEISPDSVKGQRPKFIKDSFVILVVGK